MSSLGSLPEVDLGTDLPAMEDTAPEGFAPEPVPEPVAPPTEETIEIVTEPPAPLAITPQPVVPSEPVPERMAEPERVFPKVVEVVKVKTRLNVRSEPEIRGGNIVFQLELGERIPVLRENEGWYQVEYAPGKSGWISKIYSKLME